MPTVEKLEKEVTFVEHNRLRRTSPFLFDGRTVHYRDTDDGVLLENARKKTAANFRR